MTTATSALRTPRRLVSLARAEWIQFRRNKVILFMSAFVLLVIPVLFFRSISGAESAADSRALASTALQMLVLMAIVFVVYYSVLSMATTRRDEGVLTRLRTGEASDREILLAICTPSSLFAILASVLGGVLCVALGSALPINVFFYLVAILGGVVLAAALALITSAYTSNAEAAQVTSMPVIVLGMLSIPTLRGFLPDPLALIAARNPFGALLDLVHLGWTGQSDPLNSEAATMNLAETFSSGGMTVLILMAWCVALVLLVPRVMRWDNR
ncbi:ABC-2 type transporter [Corynebacterium ciconiae DSM 44920]|uniref:ABC transporter permease n=1 Tax=Corynebacterium ciconiae TaxID=227319 RepID=UPI00035D567C|nr:ABC transporter permease [Corynebacterium ciconiae]WKD62088.1 ABC-2 type transporter [Corynebacterium ciconiae DSM 44920]